MNYERNVSELIELLEKSGEDHWVIYFGEVLDLYKSGRIKPSYKKLVDAYGGMCSFNDIPLNFLSNEEVKRVKHLRTSLWKYCKSNTKGIFDVFGL